MKAAIRCSLSSWILAGAAVAADPAATQGAGAPLQLEPVLVTARGRAVAASRTPGGTGLITRDDVFTSQPLSLTNATARLPGIDKSSDSAWGSAINIRGLGRNRVLFLIDGCRVNTATDINAQFGLVDPLDIERIEVLKGPISALYGSGSVGGIVNVLTRTGTFSAVPEWHGDLMTAYHTNPAGPHAYGRTVYSASDWWASLSGSWRQASSYEDADNQDVPNSQFEYGSGKLQLGRKWAPSQISEVQVQHLAADDVGIPGRGLALPVGPEVTYPSTARTLVSLKHSVIPGAGRIEESAVTLFYQCVEREVRIDQFPAGPLVAIVPEADHDTWGLRWQNLLDLEPHTVIAGLDLWNWQYEGTRTHHFATGAVGIDAPLPDSSQTSAGMFAEDDWRLTEQLTVNFGGRTDFIYSESEDAYDWLRPPGPIPVTLKRDAETQRDLSWAAHAGVTWEMHPALAMTGIVASSYRTPDVLDRFKYLNLGGGGELYGNPNLDPERSLFLEYGLHGNLENVLCGVSVFRNAVDDLIVDPSPGIGVRQLQNVEKAEIRGAEAELEWRFRPAWAVYANLAYTEGWNRTTDDYLDFITPLNGLAGVRTNPERGCHWYIELEWAAEQDHVPAGSTTTDNWITLNAGAGYRFAVAGTRHELLVAADNLFDTDYIHHLSTARGFELKEPGTALRAAWRVSF